MMMAKKQRHHHSSLGFYWQFIKLEKGRVAVLLAMPLIWCSCETYAPYLIKNLLDHITITPDSHSLLISSAIIYVLLMTSIEGSLRLSSYLAIQIIPRLKEEIRKTGADIIGSNPYSFFQVHPSGTLLSSLKNLVDSFEQLFLSFFYGLYPITITFIVSLILINSVNRWCAGFFALWYLGMNVITFFFLKPTLQTAHDYAQSEGKLLGFIADLFKNTLTVKTFSSHQLDQNLLQNLQEENIQKAKDTEWVTFKADSLRGLISFLLLSFMFVFLVNGWQKNLISLGDFAFITTVCFYVRRSTWMATVYILNFLKYAGMARHSFSFFINNYSKPKNPALLKPTKNVRNDISFKNISFRYGKDKRVYQHFNLHIPQKQKIGIMGPSGAGKTTLIQLLLGLFKSETGKIYLGDYSINGLDPEFFQNQISYVSQTSPLFHRSIYENIQYGDQSASPEKIVEAAEACLCHHFISRFELGFETIIGEDGVKLSGGQRQRLALARAYLKNSPILILDEATSALDTKTERKILDAFLQKDKTMIVVSHRFSALSKLDRLLVLEDGKIMQDGKPSKILEKLNGLTV